MVIQTKHFGDIEADEEKLLTFKDGIPGFEELHTFLLIAEDEENGSYFYWLQSVDNPQTAFLMIDMIRFKPDYDPRVEAEQVADLESDDPADFVIYNIAVMPKDVKEMTVNLRAPVVINPGKRLGKQVVCMNEEYDVKHYLFV